MVGDWSTLAVTVNSIRPTRSELGEFARNVRSASAAAPSRDGFRSVAPIELEVSVSRNTAASSTGTATDVCGRAAATISTASASANAAYGAWRRHPGVSGATDGLSAGAANACAARSRVC